MSVVLARLSGLSVAYRTDGKTGFALESIDLDILSGERMAIIGESGSGKSTLALALAGLLPETARQSGEITWPGFRVHAIDDEPIPSATSTPTPTPPHKGEGAEKPSQSPSVQAPLSRQAPPEHQSRAIEEAATESPSPLWGGVRGGGALAGKVRNRGAHPRMFPNKTNRVSDISTPLPGRDIGFVFQDPGSSLNPVLSIGEQIAEVARRHLAMNWSDAYRHALDLLERVHIPQPQQALKAYPHQLSGGQRQRVAIASAIAAKPKLLIADEPTSALDMIVQAEIVSLLDTLVREDGMTLLFITHDIALVSGFADRIAVFRNARLIEAGPTAALLSQPRDAYTKSLIASHIDLATPPLIAETA